MALRPFVVVTLAAKDTVLGSLSDAGARVELMASPQHAVEAEGRWAIAFEVRNAPRAAMDGARERLVELGLDVADEDLGHTWRVTGWIPEHHVARRAHRLLWQATMDAAPAWIVMENGLAQVRMRPLHSGPIDVFHEEVAGHLERHGIRAEARQVALQATEYEARLQHLQGLVLPLTPQALS